MTMGGDGWLPATDRDLAAAQMSLSVLRARVKELEDRERKVPTMSEPRQDEEQHPEENAFWRAFEFDPNANRWLLAPGLSPLEVIPVVDAKRQADRVLVAIARSEDPLEGLDAEHLQDAALTERRYYQRQIEELEARLRTAKQEGAREGYHDCRGTGGCSAECLLGYEDMTDAVDTIVRLWNQARSREEALRDELELIRTSQVVPKDAAPQDTSDGYHTFEELYAHRNALTALAFTLLGSFSGSGEVGVWKSWEHFENTPPMYPGFFITGTRMNPDDPDTEISYHLPREYWNLVKVRVVPQAPEFTGYSPGDVAERILAFLSAHD